MSWPKQAPASLLLLLLLLADGDNDDYDHNASMQHPYLSSLQSASAFGDACKIGLRAKQTS